MTEPTEPAGTDAPWRPWRLIVLIGWVVFVLAYDQRIPGVRLDFAGSLLAVVVLMTGSWFAMPNRRAELIGFATLIGVGAVGVVADLTIPQKLALIGFLMLLPLAYMLWLLRHASLRVRLVLIAVVAGIIALEFFLAGFEALVELATTR